MEQRSPRHFSFLVPLIGLALLLRLLLFCAEWRAEEAAADALCARGPGRLEATLLDLRGAGAGEKHLLLRLDDGLRLELRLGAPAGAGAAAEPEPEAETETEAYRPGQRLGFAARLHRSAGARNPGGFDAAAYDFARDVQLRAELSAPRIRLLDAGARPRDWPARLAFLFRASAAAAMRRHLGEREGGILAGLLLGEKSALDAETEEDFRRAGLSHLLVLSGGNLAAVLQLFGLLWARALPRLRARLLAELLTALVYTALSGWEPSLARAFWSCFFALAAHALRRPCSGRRRLGYAALVMLLAEPRLALRLSFQMSLAACAGILLWFEPWRAALGGALIRAARPLFAPARGAHGRSPASAAARRRLLRGLRSYVLKPLSAGLALGAAAQLALLPFALPLRQAVGPLQLLGSLPALALNAFIVALGLLALPALLLVPGQSALLPALLAPLRGALRLLCLLARAGAAAGLRLQLRPADLCWIAPLLAAALLARRRGRSAASGEGPGRRAFVRRHCLPLCLSVGLALRLLCVLAAPDYYLAFVDVGQGAAAFLQAKSGACLLYDCGPEGASGSLLDFLRARGVGRLDFLVISHMHSDHCGAFEALLRAVEVDCLLLPRLPADAPGTAAAAEEARLWHALGERARQRGCAVLEVGGGERVRWRGLELEVLAGGGLSLGNEGSILLAAELGAQEALLLGDMTREGWPRLCAHAAAAERGREGRGVAAELAAGRDMRLMQVPHHGSRGSLPEAAACPFPLDLAVVQCGRRNRYGHPHAAVLEFLRESGAEIFRNDEDGCVELSTRGADWTLAGFFSGRRVSFRGGLPHGLKTEQ